MKYTAVANRTNAIATVHVASCGSLTQGQGASSTNAVRRVFDDGLSALEYACAEIPTNYGFCALCLKGANGLAKNVR
jgi:hypothetical protein